MSRLNGAHPYGPAGGARPDGPVDDGGEITRDQVIDEIVRNTVAMLVGATHVVRPLVVTRPHFLRLFREAAEEARDAGRPKLADYLDDIGRWLDAAGAFSRAGTQFAISVGFPVRPDADDAVDGITSLLATLRAGDDTTQPPIQPPPVTDPGPAAGDST